MTPGSALDVACGECRNAVWLAEQGWRVTGRDFSGVALSRAAELARRRSVDLTLEQRDLVEEGLGGGSFDLVILMYLHLPPAQVRSVLRQAASAVAPGGTVLVIGHDRSNIDGGYGGPQNPELHLTPDEVVSELSPLEISRADLVLRVVETEDGDQTAIDSLVRARRLP